MRGDAWRPLIRRIVLASFVVLLATLAPTRADHCTTWSTSDPEIDTGTTPFGSRHYVDNDPCQPDCLFSIWYYEEVNGIPGLQRGDEVVDDTCHGMIEADVIIS